MKRVTLVVLVALMTGMAAFKDDDYNFEEMVGLYGEGACSAGGSVLVFCWLVR